LDKEALQKPFELTIFAAIILLLLTTYTSSWCGKLKTHQISETNTSRQWSELSLTVLVKEVSSPQSLHLLTSESFMAMQSESGSG